MEINLNFEYIGAHLIDYIENENFFDTFEIDDIRTIMKYSHLTADQFITLLKKAHSAINARKLYTCTRKANVTIKNIEEAVSIPEICQKIHEIQYFDGIIDLLNQKEKEISDSTQEIKKLQDNLKAFQNENQNTTKESTVNQTNENDNHSKEIMIKIAKLKKSNNFNTVYNFLNDLSLKGNHEMLSKACEEGLWKKIAPKEDKYSPEQNVLHFACEKGNLRLVKSLIECGCDKDAKDNYDMTPLIWASGYGHLEVVKYLISVGADKEAKNKDGYTPLIYASEEGQLEVVKYLISVGADKKARDNDGKTALMLAKRNVKKYLKTICAE